MAIDRSRIHEVTIDKDGRRAIGAAIDRILRVRAQAILHRPRHRRGCEHFVAQPASACDRQQCGTFIEIFLIAAIVSECGPGQTLQRRQHDRQVVEEQHLN